MGPKTFLIFSDAVIILMAILATLWTVVTFGFSFVTVFSVPTILIVTLLAIAVIRVLVADVCAGSQEENEPEEDEVQ